MNKYAITTLFLSLLTTSSFAKRFSNQYCEFELPSGWECVLEGSEYVCQSNNKDRQREAIIILAAKKRGPQDELAAYQAYLKEAKTYNLPGGRTQVSEARYTQKKNIGNHPWIDSLHLASEVPGFYTRYLATVKVDLGVAVTFSVAKDNYNDYKDVFDKIIESLKVFRQQNASTSGIVLKGDDKDLLDDGGVYIPSSNPQSDISRGAGQGRASGSGSSSSESLFYIIIIAAVAGFIIIRKRKKK